MAIHSIRTRILGGFLALLLLQVGLAVAQYRAEQQVELASAEGFAAEQAANQVAAVASSLHAAQLRLADFLRVGDAAQRDAVEAALTSFGAQANAASGLGLTSLTGAATDVATALHAVISATETRRDASRDLLTVVVSTQNGLAALAQAITHAPDRATADAFTAALSIASSPLTLASRYALNSREQDDHEVVAAAQGLRDALLAAGKTGSDVPARLTRLVNTTVKQLDAIEPGVTALGQAAGAETTNLTGLNAVIMRAESSVAAITSHMATDRDLRQQGVRMAQTVLRATLLASAGGGCALGVLLAVVVGLSITRPIGRLAAAMRRIGNGELDDPVPDQQPRRNWRHGSGAACYARRVCPRQALGGRSRSPASADRRAKAAGRSRS